MHSIKKFVFEFLSRPCGHRCGPQALLYFRNRPRLCGDLQLKLFPIHHRAPLDAAAGLYQVPRMPCGRLFLWSEDAPFTKGGCSGYGGNPCCISLSRKQIQKQRGINLDQRQFLNRQRRNPRELCACGDSIGEHAEHSSHYCLRRGCGCSRFTTRCLVANNACIPKLYRKQGEKGTYQPRAG